MKTMVNWSEKQIEKIEKKGDEIKILEGLRRHKEDFSCKPNLDKFKETDFSLRHEKVKDRVLSILKEDKYSRVDDFYLCLLYWVKTGQIKINVDFKDFKSITKPESISRARREIFTEARNDPKLKYLLNNEATELRTLEESNYHDYYSDKKLGETASLVK